MKQFLQTLVFLIPLYIFSQPYVTVDGTTYTHEQLIVDVLIDNPCAIVENVTSVTGTNFGAGNGIGYFENTNPNFPLSYGIVLATGDISGVPGPNATDTFPGGVWPGDAQLFNYIQGLGIDPGLSSYNDATIMEFDFTPLNDSISFNFVFASNEYGIWQCNYADAFAFFLENTDTGEIVNMGLVPDTPGEVPISVTTIRNNAHNGSCASANPEFFSTYYGAPGGLPNATAPVNLNGHTVLMQAWSYVVPNTLYRMKLVIADRNDNLFDSAVFIQGGSFFLGVDLGEDLTVGNGTAGCETDIITIGVFDASDPEITYAWYVYDEVLDDFVIIPGETNPTLDVTETGLYKIEVNYYDGACFVIDEIFVEFVSLPIAASSMEMEVCDALPNDGFAEFMLTDLDATIINGQPDVFVAYYETLADAELGDLANQIISPYTNIIVDEQIIFARLEETSMGCFVIIEITLTVNPAPPIELNIETYELCDDDVNGSEIFDLTSKNTEILNGLDPLEYTITFYITQVQAINGTNPIANPVNFNSAGQTIYVRVVNNETGCFSTTEFELIVNPIPQAFPVSTIIVCDLNNDDLATFFLPVAEIELLGDQTDITVTYHETLPDAQSGVSQIPDPTAYVNIDTPFQTIYVRLVNDITGCVNTSSFLIEVRPVEFIPFELEDLELCLDGPSDIGHLIDLTVQEDFIFGGLDPSEYVVTYHLTQLEAAAGINAIADPTAYPNIENPQVIWVRLVNIVINCVEIGSFNLQIYINPVITPPADMTPYELCDDEVADGFTEFDLITKINEITGGNPEVNTSFHESQADADTGDNPLPLFGYTNIINPQTIYVRVVDINNGCAVFTNFELIVHENPPFFSSALEVCDTDNDGFAEFDLTLASNPIIIGNPDITISYHETEVNAINNAFPLADIYNNISAYTQIIFGRLENIVTGCLTISPLTLQVLDSPEIEDPSPLILCDYNNNNTSIFDLTLAEPEIFANIADPTGYTINYYQTQADANSGANAIPDPTAYVNISNPQTIYIVVEDINNGCQSQTTLQLIVTGLPDVTFPFELELCDVTNTGDEIEAFDLEALIPEITVGNTSLIVTFHETHPDAQSGDDPLVSPYENILSNPQDIWIRVEDSSTGCVLSDFEMTLTLIVNPLPSPNEPEPLEVCDPDSDGFAEFDLDSTIPQILGGEPDVSITFHETLLDAQEDLFALSSPYFNIVANQQTIYVRVENNLTGCHTVVELLLIVHPTPEVPLEIPDLIVCSPDQVDVGIEFDLTLQSDFIYGDQDPEVITLTYHETEASAIAGTPFIVTPESYANTSNPQTIWVRLSIGETGCDKVGSFELIVNTAPEIAQPADLDALELCDDESPDGFREFDLTVMIPAITLDAPAGMEVQFYKSEADAQNQENQIDPDTSYTNIENPQIIWVRVFDADTQCEAFTRFTLRVLPNPSPNDPDPIELCGVDENVGQEFDLTIREAQILGGEPGVSISYYVDLEEAREGDPDNAIPNPESYTNTESPQQIIYVRVENDITGCYTIVELLIIVNPLPDLTVSNYVICELGNDGVSVFDLTSKIDEILATQEPGDYTVSFHEIAGDEQVPQNAIPPVQLPNYTNSSNPQTIYVYVENNDTGCFTTGSFDLIVIEGVTATPPAEALEACEDELGSGVGTFDLTQLNAVILNGQAPPEYELTYHESEEDAQANINAIPEVDLPNYQSGSTTIWARVTRFDPVFEEECYEVVAIQLLVTDLPLIADLLDSYRLCVDEFGNPIAEEFGATSPPTIDTGLSTPDYIFIWEIDGQIQFDQTQGAIIATQGGVYTVTVIDAQTGCESQASTTVTVSSPPLIYSAQTVTSAFAGQHAIEATAEGLGDYIFQLDDGPFQDIGFWDNVSPGTHIVTITDRNGCGTVTIEVSVIDYPLFFTPNNDGYHDTWNIIGIGSMPTAKIYIFDRHGKLLKQISPTGQGWDGTYNGRPLPSSD